MQGKIVNGYTLQRLLGVGGMAEVWYAENEIGKPAAVKILNQNLSGNQQIVERFHNEALVMVKLSHPNIRQVYGYGYIDDRHCIIMEYLDGSDLETLIKQGRRFTEEELRRWWDQIAHALNYTHSMGIIHRDIKPSNLFLDNWGNIKLLDFGIAKIKESISLTHTGAVMGTLMYMSPEQVKDSKYIDHHTDIYSLAVTFAHLLSGKAPYDSTTSSNYEIQVNIVTKPLEMDGVPAAWRGFLTPYLEKEPEKRPELQPFQARTSNFSQTPSQPRPVASTTTEAKTTAHRMPKPEYVTPIPKPYQEEHVAPSNTEQQEYTPMPKANQQNCATEEKKTFKFWPWLVGLGAYVVLYFVLLKSWGTVPLVSGMICYTIIASFTILLIWLIRSWEKKNENPKIPWIIAISALSVLGVCVFINEFINYYSYFTIIALIGLLRCLACGLAEAALFVYRPNKFKALPWIVFAIMGIIFFYGWVRFTFYMVYLLSFHGILFGFYNSSIFNLAACSVPILTFFVLQIVRTAQKKKQNA